MVIYDAKIDSDAMAKEAFFLAAKKKPSGSTAQLNLDRLMPYTDATERLSVIQDWSGHTVTSETPRPYCNPQKIIYQPSCIHDIAI